MIAELDNDIIGAAILRDWLGGGGEVVPQDKAEARVKICLKCPHHFPARWWEQAFKNPVARAIRRQLEVKNKIGLKLSCEESLGLCRICGCCLRTKSWTPIRYIGDHTSAEKLSEYPDFCWIKTEINESHNA